MRPTRPAVATGALVPLLAGLSILFATPVPLVGAALIGAWLVGRQVAFADRAVSIIDGMAVELGVAAGPVRPGATAPVELAVTVDRDPRATLTVTAQPPAVADVTSPIRVVLGPAARRARTSVDARWPIAGRHAFQPTTVAIDDGLFVVRVSDGRPPTIVVEPPRLRDIHVGVGGTRTRTSYGEHKANRFGSGIEPATIRAAQVGDPLSHIDWKATARLGQPYVREFEVETDRDTVLVLDTRASMGDGPPGEEKIALLRSVLLSMAAGAAGYGDPVAAATINSAGIDDRLQSGTADVTYREVRRLLDEAKPATDAAPTRGRGRRQPVNPAVANRRLGDLSDDEGAFAANLRPFLAEHGSYRARITDGPLFAGLRELSRPAGERRWFLIATDDEHAGELRETVSTLRGEDHAITCYLAPSVLYRPIEDLDAAYVDYAAFETLRRELTAIPGVQAFEVGPRDRLHDLLERADGRRRAVIA